MIESHLTEDANRTLPEDVLDGLTRPFKQLPPKHFYDARGSELFERICALPEYYPTRTERAILEACAGEIVAAAGAAELVELGSGAATKTRILLDAMGAAGTLERYVPFDVTEQMVHQVADELQRDYPGLEVHGVVGDFERHLSEIPPPRARSPRLLAFLGGTIGNFTPGHRQRFLRSLAALLGPGDHLLLGTDLVKDPAVLEAAYNDSQGVTAQFNLNLLEVLNRELGADFTLEDFEHVAFYDAQQEWIEMRLRAKRALRVTIEDVGLVAEFRQGEEMRTEISAKFTRARVHEELASAGLELAEWYTDERDWFALSLARLNRTGPAAAPPA